MQKEVENRFDIADSLRGKSEQEAINFLTSNELIFRITKRENKFLFLSPDYAHNRFNLHICSGLVTVINFG